ncbi:MAG: squalene synthase HpnC [Alphaproteobacteria bacterium]
MSHSPLLAQPDPGDIPSIETPSGKNADTENFPVGSWLIRPDLRQHVHAFYRFARAADDVSDNPLLEPAEKLAILQRFRDVLNGMDDQSAPAAMNMRASLKQSGVSAQHCHDLLTAFCRDATQLRYRDWDDLLDYCRYSASPVGRYVLALHGIGEQAWPTNDALCSALQIINHIQDCADDYRELDRVYIPADMLAARNADIAMLAAAHCTVPLRATLTDMLDRLEPVMQKARALPRHVPDLRLRLETAVIASLADSLIRLLRRRDPLYDKVTLGKSGKIIAALYGCCRAW